MSTRPVTGLTKQTVGNAGLYYVCYRLSLLAWNVMPTARNARGIDIIIYSQAGEKTATIQVKALSKRAAVGVGASLNHLVASYVVICRGLLPDCVERFVLSRDEARRLAHPSGRGDRKSYWLEPGTYETESFRDRWDKIGGGL